MKMLWNNFKAAFAMFSKIPVPEADWSAENMKYMLCFFPLIGAVIGGLSLLAAWLGMKFGYAREFVAVILTLLPILVTGGIHVDGLLDTSDALGSWRDRERRLEILKDPHTGAFAVITACVYFLAWYGAYTQVWQDLESMKMIALSFLLSRSLSGIGVVSFPKASTEGTVAAFSRGAKKMRVKKILIGYVILIGLAMLWIRSVQGAIVLAGAGGIFLYYRHMAIKYFGGTTGDLSGWFLCICEAGMALLLAASSAVAV